MAPTHETLAEITGFLERFPPFSALTGEALDALGGTAEIEYFAAGAQILVQEGAPSESLFVVRRGSVELLDDGEVVDVLEEGESFGHPSLLSGLSPAFTVRAREDSLCYLFPAEATAAALADPAGVRFLASTLEERLERAASRLREPSGWGTAPVGERARRQAAVDPDLSIRAAAVRMTEEGSSSVVVRLAGGGFGIVTDHHLRARVVTGEVSSDAPLSAAIGREALSVRADRPTFDVLVDMLEAGVEQAVVVEHGGTLVGVVDQASLLDPGSPSPLVLRREIERAGSVAELVTIVRQAPGVAVRLLDASVEPLDVLSVLATTVDAVTRRLTDFAVAELGDPPALWAWLALGSEARREQTLATDQDNGLAHDGEGPDVEGYFATFAERVNRWLADCGYAECRAGVMARNPGWRLSRQGWIDLLERWLRAPTRRDVHMAMIGLDYRKVAGPLPLEADLDTVLASAPGHPYFLERLTAAAVEPHPPIGFLREFVVERSGEHVGTLDLKDAGTGPVVNLARRHALAAGVATKSTVGRLRAAAARASLDAERAVELEEAFATISRVRLEHQAAQVERGVTPDNHVDPRELAPLARRQLKEAFRAVARAQRSLDVRAATRIR